MKTANKNKTKYKLRKPVKLVVVLVLVAILLGGLGFAGYQAYEYYNGAMALVHRAEDLKTEMKLLVTHIEKGNYEAANLSVQKIDNLSAEMRATLNEDRWQLAQEKAPKYGDDLKTAIKYLDVVDEASNIVIKPVVKHLREKGLPSKSMFTKIDPELGKTLNEYAAFIDELCPAVEKVLDDFNALPQFEYEKLESKVSKYKVLAKDNETEIKAYLKFAKETSDGFIKPVAKYLVENGSALKIDISIDNIGPEMANQILVIADGIDQLCPLAEKVLKDVNALPAFKIEKVENKLSKYRKLAKDNETDIVSLIKFAEELSTGLIRPAAAVMTRSPMSKLKTADGDIDTKIIRDYLGLVDTAKPYLTKINDTFKNNKLLKDHAKQTAKITVKVDKAIELMNEYDAYIPYINIILGDGSDKTYMIIAQNSAEMRSGGGLPASIGIVTIKDGILHIGDFSSFLSVLPFYNKGINTFSKNEIKIFSQNWYGDKLTAATVNPHFPRAAQLLANGYKKKHKVKVDGVISMTPAIVGRLIGVTGPIVLSNGVKLDEKYAVKYLQHDIYYQYHNKKAMTSEKRKKEANKLENQIFAEAAKKVIKGVMSDLNVKSIVKLIEVVKKSSEDRVFCMWMADSQAQETVKNLGSSGSLNYDPQKPELGVFFNIKDGNKLGIHVNISVKLGKETVNKDGSVTYPVKVIIKNNIDSKSLAKGKNSSYLTSSSGGSMKSIIYFFAPCGGNISNFKCSAYAKFNTGKYQDLKVYYNPNRVEIFPKKSVTFNFKVTTAPGVNVKPKIVTTPLLMEYKNAKAPK